ncbi:hypothetical protein N7478_004425 [Penicillium angulare]|uniref:uncharacterized protein n=1 Tax=Penicillium angulare TaxID=116970 RepID=UPI00253FEE74|nr:uncharacterized protein N7478_004425 [Penicillium angulare]KAJ5279053.1 hypothetical protein N7478_004425 [Penicillium angulare]
MAPSTSNPTDLRRAPVACLECRKAKVRCFLSANNGRCDRCRTNETECVFTQSKRARLRAQPYPQRPGSETHTQSKFFEHTFPEPTYTGGEFASPRLDSDERFFPIPSPTVDLGDGQQQRSQNEHPGITNAVRARIVTALAAVRSKRGSPFSFITSGDSPSFSTQGDYNYNNETPGSAAHQNSFGQSQEAPTSLKLSRLLRPLKLDSHHEGSDEDWRPPGSVKMPSYISSMTLGQTITDPIEGGILTAEASSSLFQYFMVHMNAKWEYVLDPHIDTHDSVRGRNGLLFTTILFCSSKFANFSDNLIQRTPDQFLQSRLCSLTRNLVMRALAEGDRSIEIMQALYLLVCWKDADDDVSYLHSGYAFRILHDLDLERGIVHSRQMARQKRIWLALFRQDRQQSLFFMRRASLSQGDDDTSFLGDLDAWLKMPYALPFDFAACCSADIRCIQSKMRNLVQRSSVNMLPCLLELMDAELISWRAKWNNHLQGEGIQRRHDGSVIEPDLLHPGKAHLTNLVAVWENGVKLNVSSAIFRQALMASVSSSLEQTNEQLHEPVNIDLSTIQETLSPNPPGLVSSIESAFGVLRHLMEFPTEDLRRAPDAVLLLAPNAAIFLCLLLCLPGHGILGPSFQSTAIGLTQDIAHRVRQSIQSPQDTVALHSAYLESLVDLLDPLKAPATTEFTDTRAQSHINMDIIARGSDGPNDDSLALQAAQVLTSGIATHTYDNGQTDPLIGMANDPSLSLHMQGIANILEGSFFCDIPSFTGEGNIN